MHLLALSLPLKSAAGESLQRCASDSLGLLGDRRWMVVAAGTGRFLTSAYCRVWLCCRRIGKAIQR